MIKVQGSKERKREEDLGLAEWSQRGDKQLQLVLTGNKEKSRWQSVNPFNPPI